MIDLWSFFPYWSSKILLLRYERVESLGEKPTFQCRRDASLLDEERKILAHEVQDYGCNCACGMV